jgi:hypothetical protein
VELGEEIIAKLRMKEYAQVLIQYDSKERIIEEQAINARLTVPFNLQTWDKNVAAELTARNNLNADFLRTYGDEGLTVCNNTRTYHLKFLFPLSHTPQPDIDVCDFIETHAGTPDYYMSAIELKNAQHNLPNFQPLLTAHFWVGITVISVLSWLGALLVRRSISGDLPVSSSFDA